MFISVGSTYVSQIHGISAVSSEGVIAQLSPYLSIKTVLHCFAVMGRNSSGLNPKKNRAAASRKDKEMATPYQWQLAYLGATNKTTHQRRTTIKGLGEDLD